MKTKENRSRKEGKNLDVESNRKTRKSKEKYIRYGSSQERRSLNKEDSDEESLIQNNCKIDIIKM